MFMLIVGLMVVKLLIIILYTYVIKVCNSFNSKVLKHLTRLSWLLHVRKKLNIYMILTHK